MIIAILYEGLKTFREILAALSTKQEEAKKVSEETPLIVNTRSPSK